jgi:arsenite-transporting ATPase
MRIILYTGKGGVGKTSVAAATALRIAERGQRTVVLSTDPAHSLGDSFDTVLGPEPRLIASNLWAQEVNVLHEIDVYWGTIQRWLHALLSWGGVDNVIADEMAILPGMEEMCALLYIMQHHDSGEYDAIIVDCAPTAETLRLLSFPDVLRWWIERLFPIQRSLNKVVAPLLRGIWDIPAPTQDVFDAIEDLFERLEKLRILLTDSTNTTMRLVLNPEKMVIKEAQRTYTYLGLYGYHTDLIVANRMLPALTEADYFSSWRDSQERYFAMIEQAFAPLPIKQIPYFEQEVVGLPMLSRMGEALFGDSDPLTNFHPSPTQEITAEGDDYYLSIMLPFTSKEEINLTHNGDELAIHIGNFRRNIILPRALATLTPKEAKLNESTLRIRFSPTRAA